MLTPDQIKPFLLNADKYIRRAAVAYFAESWSRDPDLIPIILDAYARFGDREDTLSLGVCDRFLVTGPSLDLVLEHLANADHTRVIESLNRVIAHAPGELLLARGPAILEVPKLLPDIVTQLQRRRDFAGWSGDKLWQELQDYASRAEDESFVGDLDDSYADDLIDALSQHDVPDADTLCRLLRELQGEDGWLEIFLVDLAGERRIHQAIPALVDKFKIDTDLLPERCAIALAEIGDPEASRLIRDAFPTEANIYKFLPSELLGRIKHQESEDAILALLETEQDLTVRTLLCASLCELFSERAIEVVTKEIESDYDTELTSLEEELLPVAEVLGVELPEAEQWKQDREQEEERLARLTAEWESGGINPFAGLEEDDLDEDEFDDLDEDEDDVPRDVAAIIPATIRRTGPKVGRNDPCPCGSGKKYKKCCGKGGP